MYNKELLINDVPPLTTVLFDELRSTITVPDCRDINLAVFKKDNVELELRMIDQADILLVSEEEPEQNRKQAGYVNMGGARQMTKLPGND